ncbi:MAG TPA: phosphoserine transaminase [Pseudonocardia sp.]|jgi:phosphoserine aminotransferase
MVLPIDRSRLRHERLQALAHRGADLVGTSHRGKAVQSLIGRVQSGLRELFDLPPGYQVVLGNGGTSAFRDAAAFGLIRERSLHLTYGDSSARFARIAQGAPFLAPPVVIEAGRGRAPEPIADPTVDVIAWAHQETSAGIEAAVYRPPASTDDQLVVIDAGSAAGGLPVRITDTDVYHFSARNCFDSDGGLWLALLSPAALERIARISAGDRWIPAFLSLAKAVKRARWQRTGNTPPVVTLFLLAEQIDWMLGLGGLAACVARARDSASRIYGWAERSPFARPLVGNPAYRSPVVAAIELAGSVDAGAVASTLRANGIVDRDPHPGAGRNQLRISTFPTVEPEDISALTAGIDRAVERLGPG